GDVCGIGSRAIRAHRGMVWSKYAVKTAPWLVVALITNHHWPEESDVFETKCPRSNRINGIGWTAPPGGTDIPVAVEMGSSLPFGWKNVKWTTLLPAVPGSTYV